ncbi:hypothetical protein BJ912DRAFT_937057 [Pholiota molesta]|nr:hypothetical protein BJ912DRAFT_937057 [Pholiota molesta]
MSNSIPFSIFIDFARFSAQQCPDRDIILISRASNNEWSWETLKDPIMGSAKAKRLEAEFLPRLAQSTDGSFSMADGMMEEGDSSDNEDEEELEIPAGIETQPEIIPKDDPLMCIFDSTSEKFEQSIDVEDGKEVFNLIDFDGDIIFPKATDDLHNIFKELKNLNFYINSPQAPSSKSQPDDLLYNEETESLFTPAPLSHNQDAKNFTYPTKKMGDARFQNKKPLSAPNFGLSALRLDTSSVYSQVPYNSEKTKIGGEMSEKQLKY